MKILFGQASALGLRLFCWLILQRIHLVNFQIEHHDDCVIDITGAQTSMLWPLRMSPQIDLARCEPKAIVVAVGWLFGKAESLVYQVR